MNTQQELEQERAELLSKNAVMEQEISDLQRYIDTHLARSVRSRHVVTSLSDAVYYFFCDSCTCSHVAYCGISCL